MTIAELETRSRELAALLANPETPADELDAAITEAETVRVGIEEHNARVTRANEARTALSGATPIQPAPQTSNTRVEGGQTEVAMSAGEAFIRSGAAERFKAQGYQGNVTADVPLEVRTLIDSGATQAGAFQRNPLLPNIVQAVQDRPLAIADIINRGETSFSSVDYIQEDTAAGGGAVAVEVAEGASKPEGALTFSQKTAPVATIAWWVPMTRQAADDTPRLRTYVDGRLRYGLLWRLDKEILLGDGSSPNMRGLQNASGIGTYAPTSAEARVISIRKAKTVARKAEVPPDGVVLAPDDWELIELSTDSTGEFRVTPNPLSALPPRIWGLTVVETTAETAGTALVGSFKLAATLWDRQQAQVIMGYVNDDLIKNRFVLLAELRAALTLEVPKAMVKVTFNGTA